MLFGHMNQSSIFLVQMAVSGVGKNPIEPLCDCYVQPTVKHEDGSIMVWGCMSLAGVGNLYRIDSIINSQVYLDILDSQLLDTIGR